MPYKDSAKRAEQRRRWALANPEKCRAAEAKYRIEKYLRNLADPAWREAEWARLNSAAHARRAAMGSADREVNAYVKLLRADPCSYCGTLPARGVDHVTPIKHGGQHAIDNLTAACKPCNTSKLTRPLFQFMSAR